MQRIREPDLYKLPGLAETIEWAPALMALDTMVLDPQVVQHTLGLLLKYRDDIVRMQGSETARVLAEIQGA